jgi:hypothetical protein
MIDPQDPKLQRKVREAEIVLGINQATGAPTVFYGRALLARIAHEGTTAVKMTGIMLDYETDDPQKLAALCTALKGSCDAPTEEEG